MRQKIKFFILPLIFKLILVLITTTCRVRWNNKARFEELTNSGKASVLSFWHENVLIIPWVLRNRGIHCMISDSRDGEYIARCGEIFGNKTIRGGSSSGSSRATRTALKLLKQNQPIAITPDGPRGPAHTLQDGVLWLAAVGNVPIVPFHIEATKQWRFKSWDGQKIPKPFSTIYVEVGEPYRLNRSQLDNFEPARNELEKIMMDNVKTIQQRAGTAT